MEAEVREEGVSNNAQPERRVLASYTIPNPRHYGSSILAPNVQANDFELKPQLITLVQNNCAYGGGPLEDPNQHLSVFLRICETVKTNGVHPDTYKLLLFPFSLRDKAAQWLETFPKGSITSWDDLRKGVLELEGVDSILAQNKIMQEQIQQQFEQMAKKIDSLQVAAVNTSQPSTKWGQNEENQEDQQQEQPQYVHNQSSGQNEMMKHQEIMMEKLIKNQEMARQDQEAARKDQEAARKDQATTSKNQEASIKNLERHMEQMAKRITDASPSATQDHPRDKGKATKWEECKAIIVESEKKAINQEEHNREVPQEETEERSEEDQKIKNAKSSKRDKDILKTQLQEKKERVKPHIPKLPYPQRFKKENEDKQYSKFLDIFKTLSINIPFLEALEQMPVYAKFMKEVLTKKKSLKEGQIVEMTKECSAIFQRELPEKKDDPGRFYIPCTIGNITIEKSFCDLGASINLMPLSLMRKLQISELKSTRIMPGGTPYIFLQIPTLGSFGSEKGFLYSFPNGSRYGFKSLDQ
ncbi:uncharacterized protein LOC130974964 [Arachis stenosperma]|uniref:uncharacterized protein LOC130974964 n=1 Tax=Arachis stenosperma TaxID=217475 RepID=UPI0025AC029D|nr:uncharacterized protein LOC130974964 [Arachis stenosperma]